jgi:hypothetical protein
MSRTGITRCRTYVVDMARRPFDPRTAFFRLLAAGLALLPVSTARAQAPAIDHSAVGCLVADRFPRMDACFAPAADVARARVHFRTHGTPHWYFVDMRAGGPCHEGILPKPLKSTKKVDYYIDVVDRRFAEGRTREHDPIVVERSHECRKDVLMAAGMGAASIVLGVAAGAPPIPPGFAAEGIAGPTQAIEKGSGGGGGGTVAAFVLGAGLAGGAAYYFTQKDEEDGAQFDGEWSGTTSQNREFSFTVAGDAVVRIGTSYVLGTGTASTVVSVARSLSPPIAITNGAFTYQEQGLLVTGTFSSGTAASGRLEPTRTTLTWQATRR